MHFYHVRGYFIWSETGVLEFELMYTNMHSCRAVLIITLHAHLYINKNGPQPLSKHWQMITLSIKLAVYTQVAVSPSHIYYI